MWIKCKHADSIAAKIKQYMRSLLTFARVSCIVVHIQRYNRPVLFLVKHDHLRNITTSRIQHVLLFLSTQLECKAKSIPKDASCWQCENTNHLRFLYLG